MAGSGDTDPAREALEAGRWAEVSDRLRSWSAAEVVRWVGERWEEAASQLPRRAAWLASWRALALRRDDRRGEALPWLERALAGFLEVGDAVEVTRCELRIAELHVEAADLARAVTLLAELEDRCASEPQLLPAWVTLVVRVRIESGDPPGARRVLEARGAALPAGARGLLEYLLGSLALSLGDLETAALHLERAGGAFAAGDPNRRHVLRNLASLARLRGDLDDADRLYDEADRIEPPEHELTRIGRALGAARRGRSEEALADLLAASATREVSDRPSLATTLPVFVGLLQARCGRPVLAAECVADLWSRTPPVAEAEVARALEDLADLLPPGSAAVRARLLSLDAWRSLGDASAVDRVEHALASLPESTPIPLGDLDLLRVVGAGGMGEVWEARHAPTGIPVAVKVVAARREGSTVLDAEIRKVAGLDHPCVLPVLDTGIVPERSARVSGGRLRAGTPWVSMPLARGGSLGPWPGRLPWSEIRRVLLGVLDALAHAHSRGLVHLDVKPENVLLDGPLPGARVALADFGLARATDDEADPRILGTPSFMAPEQCTAQARMFGPWTDLYAVGALAWELVTGRPPYAHSEPRELLRLHVLGQLPTLAPACALPRGAEEWIRSLLAADPGLRPHRAREAREALAALPGEAAASVHPPAPVPVTTSSEGRSTFSWEVARTPDRLTVTRAVARGVSLPERPPVPAPHPASPASGTALLTVRVPPLVGREAELGALWDLLREVVTGRARVAFVAGGRGCGRTRLVTALAELAHLHGFEVIPVRPGDAVGASLCRWLRADGASAATRARTLTARARLLGSSLADDLPDAIERGDVELLASFLAELSTCRPVLVVADDATSETPELATLRRLVALAPGARVALVVTGAGPSPLEGAVAVDLSPPTSDQLVALLEAQVRLGPELARRVVAQAMGDVGYLARWLAWLGREGAIRSTPAGLEVRRQLLHALPDAARLWRETLARWLHGLPLGARSALEALAVLGPGAPVGQWEAVCAAAGIEVPVELRRRMAEDGDPGLPLPVLEGLAATAEVSGRLRELRRAAAQTTPRSAGVTWARRQVEAGLGRSAYPELLALAAATDAAAPARQALLEWAERARDGDPPDPREVELRAAWAMRAGRPEEALAGLRAVAGADEPARLRLRVIEARALRALGDAGAARRTLEEVALRAEALGERPTWGEAEHSLGLLSLAALDTAAAERHLRRAASLGARVGLDLARVVGELGRNEEARGLILAETRASAGPDWTARAWFLSGQMELAASHPEAAREAFERAWLAAVPGSEVRAWSELMVARFARSSGRAAEARARLTSLASAHSPRLRVAASASLLVVEAAEPGDAWRTWVDRLRASWTLVGARDRRSLVDDLDEARAVARVAGHEDRVEALGALRAEATDGPPR